MAPENRWNCAQLPLTEPSVDPVQGEFFVEEGPVDALVREALQNSLDATLPGQTTRVRIYWSGASRALPSLKAAKYFSGLWEHAQASLGSKVPPPDSPMEFLVVEDFGTRGLTGDPADIDGHVNADKKNDFFWFWRNVARSEKQQSARGRWGVGKTVFPATSKLHAFFAYSATGENRPPTLMGQAVLKVHRLDGKRHSPYAYWATMRNDGLPMPTEAAEHHASFRADFRVSRATETGTTIVIPYFTAGEDCSETSFAVSALRHFFLPILTRQLSVTIEGPVETIPLDASTVDHVLRTLRTKLGSQSTIPTELEALAELGREAMKCRESGRPDATLRDVGRTSQPTWEEAFPESTDLEALRQRFLDGQLVWVRAPLWVHPNNGGAEQGAADAFIRRVSTPAENLEVYVREGLRIPDMRMLRGSSVRALLIVDSSILSRLMGDSENPAHTKWSERESRVADGYARGGSTVRFVKNMLKEVAARLTSSPKDLDETLLSDLFSIPDEDAEDEKKRPNRKAPRKDDLGKPVVPPIPAKPRRIRVNPIPGGFVVAAAAPDVRVPASLGLRVAYDVRRGDPFTAYHPFDFELGKAPVRVEVRGATVERIDGNALRIKDLEQEFLLTVAGLDENRDVKVSISAEEGGSEA